ncbi:hypothetical protein [Paraburkholderia sp. GAS348]|uniref:hypothetical protein n=1 Tax=Paraburkholderia sp. GAS348 TaxID=3035132 RepID=UPI003D1D9C18
MTNAINNMGQSNPIPSNLPPATTQGTGNAASPTVRAYEYAPNGKLADVPSNVPRPDRTPPGFDPSHDALVRLPDNTHNTVPPAQQNTGSQDAVPNDTDALPQTQSCLHGGAACEIGGAAKKESHKTASPPAPPRVNSDSPSDTNGKSTPPAREEGKNDLMVW